MKILHLAPAWEPVPPPAYGGTEAVVATLTAALSDDPDYEVLLACTTDSAIAHPRLFKIDAGVRSLRRQNLEDKKPYDWLHVSHALRVAQEAGVDCIHNHAGELAMAFAPDNIPMLTTAHCLVTRDTAEIWRRQGGWWNTISHAERVAMPPDVGGVYAGTVYNGIDVASFPFGSAAEKEDYLLFMGRISPEKGPHIACRVAKKLGMRLILAGKIDADKPSDGEYFIQYVEPYLDGDHIVYVGEADARRKRELYRRACVTLTPILWEEPFGLVLAESLACGTPVISFARGAAPEIICNGVTGYLVSEGDEDAMAATVLRIDSIDATACRRDMEERFDVPVMASAYKKLYQRIAAEAASDAAEAHVREPVLH